MKIRRETWGGHFTKRFLKKSSLLEIHNVTFHQHKHKKGIIKASQVAEIEITFKL
jgi:hypothetical protein